MTTKEILMVNLFPSARCVASGAKPDADSADIVAGGVFAILYASRGARVFGDGERCLY